MFGKSTLCPSHVAAVTGILITIVGEGALRAGRARTL
jgi:hypothetical protein